MNSCYSTVKPCCHDTVDRNIQSSNKQGFQYFISYIYRHEFIKLLRRKLEDVIGPLTEEEVEKFETDIHDSNGQETLITRITDKILHSRQFVYLL
jgi:hypothetical protein